MPLRSRHSIRSQLMWLTLIIVTVSIALFPWPHSLSPWGASAPALNRNLLNSASILYPGPPGSGDPAGGRCPRRNWPTFLDSATANTSDIDLILVGRFRKAPRSMPPTPARGHPLHRHHPGQRPGRWRALYLGRQRPYGIRPLGLCARSMAKTGRCLALWLWGSISAAWLR